MTELVQLERRHDEFPKRHARVVAVSVEGVDDARNTQADNPHLTVVSDESLSLSSAAGLIHPHAAPDGGDTDVPTTILVDRTGTVRWLYRSPSVIERLSPDEVVRAVDEHLSNSDG
jgi:alkyl hydroperoxide reductase subunit AhpC